MPPKLKIVPETISKKLAFRQTNALVSESKRFEIFKEQNLEKGYFDVAFEIEGKLLHAHKFILTAASVQMAAMLSDHLTTAKDDIPIKIANYTYDHFYEFLSFLYSGECRITLENVKEIIQIAKNYDVPSLKDFCDIYLSEMEQNIETVEEMVEFSIQYSMKELQSSLRAFLHKNSDSIFPVDILLTRGKSFVEFASHRDAHKSDEVFFEAAYKWAEHRALEQKAAAGDETFDLHDAIEVKLHEVLPNIDFSVMSFGFLMNFVLEKGFSLSPAELSKYFSRLHQPTNEINLLKDVYELAKKQALKKQKVYPNDNFDLVSSVRTDLAEIIPKIKFYKMTRSFLNDFVVTNGILTKDEADHVYDTRVTISNSGNIITGAFKDDFEIHNTIQRMPRFQSNGNNINRILLLMFGFNLFSGVLGSGNNCFYLLDQTFTKDLTSNFLAISVAAYFLLILLQEGIGPLSNGVKKRRFLRFYSYIECFGILGHFIFYGIFNWIAADCNNTLYSTNTSFLPIDYMKASGLFGVFYWLGLSFGYYSSFKDKNLLEMITVSVYCGLSSLSLTLRGYCLFSNLFRVSVFLTLCELTKATFEYRKYV